MKDRFCCVRTRKKISPAISAPLHLILQAPSPASHEWRRIAGAKRMCQICHFALDDQRGVLRCQSCGLRAHSQCGSLKLTAKSDSSRSGKGRSSSPSAVPIFRSTSDNNLLTTAADVAAASAGGKAANGNGNAHFEPRIKKLLQVAIPLPPATGAATTAQSVHSQTSDHSQPSTSTRLSSCGEYSIAASTAIAVGTTTISTETPRSESKSPEITITPGSEVADDFDGPTDRDRRQQQLHDRDRLTVPSQRQLQQRYDRHREDKTSIRYVDGPLDGALYAIVNPAAKIVDAPSSADSGISVTQVDQMKDLDRLLNALVQDAESIPDIPYHAREDSLPFSYGVPDRATLKQRQELQERLASRRQLEEQREREHVYQSPVARYAPAASAADTGRSAGAAAAAEQRSRSPYSYTAQRSISPRQAPTYVPPPSSPASAYSAPPAAPTRRVQRPTATAGLPSHYASTRPPNVQDTTEYIDRIRQARAQEHQYQQQPRYGSTQLLQLQRAQEPPRVQQYQQQQQQARTHHIQVELEDQIIPYHRERVTRHESPPRSSHSYSRSLSSSYADRQRERDREGGQIYFPSIQSEPGSRERVYRFYSSTPQQQQQQQQAQQPSSMATSYQSPPTSFSFDNFGRAIEGVEQRIRSQSAEGRRFTPWSTRERDENAEDWLRRQKLRLEEKRAASRQPQRNEWLFELKRSLGDQDQTDTSGMVKPSTYSSITRFTQSGRPQTTRSSASTPVAGLYSSDDESEFDREVEREMFNRDREFRRVGARPPGAGFGGGTGRGIQRYHSESAYDHRARASSQQSSYGSTSGVESSTPGFPTCPPTPYLNRPSSPAYKPPRSPKAARKGVGAPTVTVSEWTPSSTTASQDYGSTRAQTPVNPRPVYMGESEVKFARDMSQYWYKPNAAREETISALRYQPSGSFIIRNSNSFPGAYGLAIKVNDGVTTEDSVRHFLIEPTKYGVRLRGSAVEPVFGSLSALVYAHSIEPLALPTTLALPATDSVLPSSQAQSTTSHLLTQGAACQLLFIGVVGVELITGDDAIKRGIGAVVGTATPTVVSLRLSKHGLTLTDILRQRFFRLHFPLDGISYAAVDPANKSITYRNASRKIFAVIARAPTALENSCVVLAELEEGQPANAIVAFIQRVIAWQS